MSTPARSSPARAKAAAPIAAKPAPALAKPRGFKVATPTPEKLPPALQRPEHRLTNPASATRSDSLPLRPQLERHLGASLAGVRLVRGPVIDSTLRELDASAAAFGDRIFLRSDESDVRTIAHEAAHVVQFRRTGGVRPTARHVAPSDTSAELEARRAGDTFGQRAIPAATAEQPAYTFRRPVIRQALPPDGLALLAPASLPQPQALPDTPTPTQDAAAVAAPSPADSPDEAVRRYAVATPTQKAMMTGTLGSSIAEGSSRYSSHALEDAPELSGRLTAMSEPLPPLGPADSAAVRSGPLEASAPPPAPEPDIAQAPELPRFTANAGIADSIGSRGSDPAQLEQEGSQALRNVATTDDSVPHTAGPPPAIELAGETDPARAGEMSTSAGTQAGEAETREHDAVVTGPGPERVQPRELEHTVSIADAAGQARAQSAGAPAGAAVASAAPTAAAAAQATGAATASDGASEYLAMPLPPEVRAEFDQQQSATMQASVDAPRQQISEATATADADRQSEADTARASVDQANRDANDEQRREVNRSREEIQSERQRTIDEQASESDRVRQEADTASESTRGDIDTRHQDDQRQINDEYASTDRDIDAEVTQGERDADAERVQAERDAANQSWFSRALNWVKEAFQSLVAAIGRIFDAVRSAVGRLLDAVASFAQSLIRAIATFIVSAIQALGSILTALVDTLLGSIFPELAARLRGYIDRAVNAATAAVNRVADALIAAVNAAIAVLRAALNRLLDALQAAVSIAVMLVQAAITGDWAAVARMVLDAVLRLAGIDPPAFYALIGQAIDALRIIIDDPLGFVSNLIDAALGGFRQFGANFLQHLQAGVIGWLTGALGPIAITIPQTFDLMGVLDIVRQVLGLTYDTLRRKAVTLIGEQNVQRVEFVAGYLRTLIEGGWSALFERIQSDLAGLRDMVLGQLRDFIVTRLITAAVTRLATMFNPVGAIVQLLLAAWNFITFIREQLARIMQVVQTVVQSLSNIAHGVLQPAMDGIERTLAGLIPLAIDLLARLLGLGNVGERVREVIGGVRQTVERAIDGLITRVIGLFRGGDRAAASGQTQQPGQQQQPAGGDAGVLTHPVPVNVPGQSHELMFQVSATGATLMFASNPTPLQTLLVDWRARLPQLSGDTVREASQLLSRADRLLRNTDQEADQFVEARQRATAARDTRRAATHGVSVGDITADETTLAGVLQRLYPMFAPTPNAAGERLARARAMRQFNLGVFRSIDWATAFGIEQGTASTDLRQGIQEGAVHDLGQFRGYNEATNRMPVMSQWYQIGATSDGALIDMAARAVTSNGRMTPALRTGDRLYFTDADLSRYLQTCGQLPTEPQRYAVGSPVFVGVTRLLLAIDEIIPTKDADRFVFSQLPAQRRLPPEVDVREQLYIVGSGFGSARTQAINRDWPRFQSAWTALTTAGGNAADAAFVAAYAALNGLVPSNFASCSATTKASLQLAPGAAGTDPTRHYDVDHRLTLAQHWQAGGEGSGPGNGADERARQNTAGNLTNLRLMWYEQNRSDGGRGGSYVRFVTPSFTSQFTRARGPQWATNDYRFVNYA